MNWVEENKRKAGKTKILLITISFLFVFFMLVFPLVSVIANSLKEEFKYKVCKICSFGNIACNSNSSNR